MNRLSQVWGRKRTILALTTSVAVAVALSAFACWERILYLGIGIAEGKTRTRIARSLARRRKGVDLAISNLTIFQGKQNAYDSWILRYSPLEQYVTARLDSVIADEATPRSKRLEALLVMWDRTSDTKYLRPLLEEIKSPGYASAMARWKLMRSNFDFTRWPKFFAKLDAPPSEKIAIDVDQFCEAVHAFIKREH